MSTVYGLVLASGMSRRMGSDKLLLPWQGKSLLEHVLTAATHSPLDDTLVVLPASDMITEHSSITLQSKCRSIFNPNPHFGMGNSLAYGIDHLPTNATAVIIFLADQPEMDSEDITQVLAMYQNYYDQKCIIQTTYRDGNTGHPILFSKHFFPELSRLHGDQGGKRIIHANTEYVVRYESKNSYPNDIDTVWDYQHLFRKGSIVKEDEMNERFL